MRSERPRMCGAVFVCGRADGCWEGRHAPADKKRIRSVATSRGRMRHEASAFRPGNCSRSCLWSVDALCPFGGGCISSGDTLERSHSDCSAQLVSVADELTFEISGIVGASGASGEAERRRSFEDATYEVMDSDDGWTAPKLSRCPVTLQVYELVK